MLLLTLAVFFLLIFTGIPLAYCLMFASIIFLLLLNTGLPLESVMLTYVSSLESYSFLAIPLFVVAGELISQGGAGRRIIDFATKAFSFIPGGLGIVTVVTSMLFAGMSGSAVADSAAVGSIMIPGMSRKGYPKSFAGALVAAAGSIGIIIPPSIPMIIYAFVGGVSLGDLFIAGIIPGFVIGVSMMILCYFYAKKHGWDSTQHERYKFYDVFISFIKCLPSIALPGIILGGIFSGIFTPTEAAAVACVYGLIISMFVFKDIKMKDLPHILRSSFVTSASVLLVIAAATAMTFMVNIENVPKQLVELITTITHQPWVFLLIVNLLLIILGMFIDATSALIITVPLLLPTAIAFGVDPVHLGIIMTCNLAIGLYTPPVGVTMFVAAKIGRIEIGALVKQLVPFMVISVITLLLITYVPQISLSLVNFFK
ncbi:TRAP transporter large permease [Paenibacillus ferrarius]|uniref:TRAP transporter large permease n=1 Tax=Paenibacillus ferrarius TaxID=1469647 RepID=UPI003D297499